MSLGDTEFIKFSLKIRLEIRADLAIEISNLLYKLYRRHRSSSTAK